MLLLFGPYMVDRIHNLVNQAVRPFLKSPSTSTFCSPFSLASQALIPPSKTYAVDPVIPSVASQSAYHPAQRGPRPLLDEQWKMTRGTLLRGKVNPDAGLREEELTKTIDVPWWATSGRMTVRASSRPKDGRSAPPPIEKPNRAQYTRVSLIALEHTSKSILRTSTTT